jgi:hypothetical protein
LKEAEYQNATYYRDVWRFWNRPFDKPPRKVYAANCSVDGTISGQPSRRRKTKTKTKRLLAETQEKTRLEDFENMEAEKSKAFGFAKSTELKADPDVAREDSVIKPDFIMFSQECTSGSNPCPRKSCRPRAFCETTRAILSENCPEPPRLTYLQPPELDSKEVLILPPNLPSRQDVPSLAPGLRYGDRAPLPAKESNNQDIFREAHKKTVSSYLRGSIILLLFVLIMTLARPIQFKQLASSRLQSITSPVRSLFDVLHRPIIEVKHAFQSTLQNFTVDTASGVAAVIALVKGNPVAIRSTNDVLPTLSDETTTEQEVLWIFPCDSLPDWEYIPILDDFGTRPDCLMPEPEPPIVNFETHPGFSTAEHEAPIAMNIVAKRRISPEIFLAVELCVIAVGFLCAMYMMDLRMVDLWR